VVVLLLHKKDVGVSRGGHVCSWIVSVQKWVRKHESETLSPKRKSSGGDSRSLCGNIVRDLSCP
jgi:hypothetical protein